MDRYSKSRSERSRSIGRYLSIENSSSQVRSCGKDAPRIAIDRTNKAMVVILAAAMIAIATQVLMHCLPDLAHPCYAKVVGCCNHIRTGFRQNHLGFSL